MLCCDSYYNLGCFYVCDSCLDIGLVADADGLWTVEIGQPNGAVKFYENTYAIGDTILMPFYALNNASLHYIRVTKPDSNYYEWDTNVTCAKFKTAIRINVDPTACDTPVVACATELSAPSPLIFYFLPNEEISVELLYEFLGSTGCTGNVSVPTVTTNEFSAVATVPNNDSFTVNITPLAMPVADGSYDIPLEITDCCGNVWNSNVLIVVGCVLNNALFTATIQNNAGVVYNSGDIDNSSWVGVFPYMPIYACDVRKGDFGTHENNDFIDWVTNKIVPYITNILQLIGGGDLSYSITGSYPDELFTVSYVINIEAYMNVFGYYPCNKPLINCEGSAGSSSPFTYIPNLNCCSLAPSVCPPPDITEYAGVNPINNQSGWSYQHSFVLSGTENCTSEPLIQVTQNYGLNVVTSFWNGINGYDGFIIDISENGALPDGIYAIQIVLVDCCGQPHIYDIDLDLRTCVTGTGSFVESTVYISLSQLDQPFINQFNFIGYSGCLQDVWATAFPNYLFVTYDNLTVDPSNTFFTTEFSAHSGVQIGEVYTMTFNMSDCCNNFYTVSFNVEITA